MFTSRIRAVGLILVLLVVSALAFGQQGYYRWVPRERAPVPWDTPQNPWDTPRGLTPGPPLPWDPPVNWCEIYPELCMPEICKLQPMHPTCLPPRIPIPPQFCEMFPQYCTDQRDSSDQPASPEEIAKEFLRLMEQNEWRYQPYRSRVEPFAFQPQRWLDPIIHDPPAYMPTVWQVHDDHDHEDCTASHVHVYWPVHQLIASDAPEERPIWHYATTCHSLPAAEREGTEASLEDTQPEEM